MNTGQAIDFSGPCSWFPGSRAASAPRNDEVPAFFSSLLVLRTIQMIHQNPPPRFPVGLQPTDFFRGESPDPLPTWAPAFAGEAVLSEVLHRRVNRVNDSEHKGTLSDWRSEIVLLHAGRPRHALPRALGKAIHLYGDRSKVYPAGVMLGVYRGLLDELRARLAEP